MVGFLKCLFVFRGHSNNKAHFLAYFRPPTPVNIFSFFVNKKLDIKTKADSICTVYFMIRCELLRVKFWQRKGFFCPDHLFFVITFLWQNLSRSSMLLQIQIWSCSSDFFVLVLCKYELEVHLFSMVYGCLRLVPSYFS